MKPDTENIQPSTALNCVSPDLPSPLRGNPRRFSGLGSFQTPKASNDIQSPKKEKTSHRIGTRTGRNDSQIPGESFNGKQNHERQDFGIRGMLPERLLDMYNTYYTLSDLKGLFLLLGLLLFCPITAFSAEISLPVIEQIESSGDPSAIGDNGLALGLYQLHKAVIIDFNRANRTSHVHKDALNPKIAHKIADWYLNREIPRLLKHFKLADTTKNRIWAYNAGVGNVKKGRFPAITASYVKKYEKLATARANA